MGGARVQGLLARRVADLSIPGQALARTQPRFCSHPAVPSPRLCPDIRTSPVGTRCMLAVRLLMPRPTRSQSSSPPLQVPAARSADALPQPCSVVFPFPASTCFAAADAPTRPFSHHPPLPCRYLLHGLLMLPLDLWASPDALDQLRVSKVQPTKRLDMSKLASASRVMLLNLVGLAFPFIWGIVHVSLSGNKLLRIDEHMPSHMERLGNVLTVIPCNEVRFYRCKAGGYDGGKGGCEGCVNQ